MSTALDVTQSLAAYADPARVSHTTSFFKTGTGSYSDGDQFLGITVPNCRIVAKKHADIPLDELLKVLQSPWHEERETALIILVNQYKKGDSTSRQAIYDLYLAQTKYVNNWDLVDVSVRDIVGYHTHDHPKFQPDLVRLANSSDIWERRIAMVATWYFLTKGNPTPTKKIAMILINDQQDLIRKAVGWMLREMGKRVSREELILFLADTYKTMPRTALRYAIEHFDDETRRRYLKGEI